MSVRILKVFASVRRPSLYQFRSFLGHVKLFVIQRHRGTCRALRTRLTRNSFIRSWCWTFSNIDINEIFTLILSHTSNQHVIFNFVTTMKLKSRKNWYVLLIKARIKSIQRYHLAKKLSIRLTTVCRKDSRQPPFNKGKGV